MLSDSMFVMECAGQLFAKRDQLLPFEGGDPTRCQEELAC